MLRTSILGYFAPSRFMLCTCILSRFAPSYFTFCAGILIASLACVSHFEFMKIFGKISVSQSNRNALKRIEKQIKICPFYPLRASRVAQSPSVEVQPYLPHVTSRVPRSVHAKFHADWTRTVGARGIHTDKQTDKQTNRPISII